MTDEILENEEKVTPIIGKVSGMHPGVINGKRAHPRTNTSKPSSIKKRAAKALVGLERHLENHPGDSVSSNRASKLRGLV